MDYDVIIIGGSYAGLAAALPLARARRKILVIDAGKRRNRHANHSHGFLTQDGRPPAEIAAIGQAQLLAYETVQWCAGNAVAARPVPGGFTVRLTDGATISCMRRVLAGGVVDHLPDVPGLAERWGTHVFHCPYCHGYELNQGEIGVLAVSGLSMHHALMLPDWGPTTFFLNGAFEPDTDQLSALAARGVTLERRRIRALSAALDVVLADGEVKALAGMFTVTRSEIAGPIAGMLGCALEDTPLGQIIRTDTMKSTTVPGVFACGDAARAGGSIPLAVGDGTMAGVAAHRSLLAGIS